MSGAVFLERKILELAFSEVDVVRESLPDAAVAALAQEVVLRVSRNLTLRHGSDAFPSLKEIESLCEALVANDPAASIAYIECVQQSGASFETICQGYLAVAARRLGEWWDNDLVSFYKVTIAAGRIYAILRILRLSRIVPIPDMKRSAIFASVPGDSHTLGITIAADMAREQNWDIELFVGLSHQDLVHALELRQTALIGLSASGKRSLPALIKLIVALRISNPNARILVCGNIGTENFNLVGVTGADAVAVDLDTALGQMERLIASNGFLPN
ncbi:MAG: cobalamin-dependent protein [Gemmobacter sp.]|nr:cobalamin-dependent protein [Gemmobacter sp.]